jgi:hypothetical protein
MAFQIIKTYPATCFSFPPAVTARPAAGAEREVR